MLEGTCNTTHGGWERGVQGLLEKQPARRLDWPQLLEHPFVREIEQEGISRQPLGPAGAQPTAQAARAARAVVVEVAVLDERQTRGQVRGAHGQWSNGWRTHEL